MSSLYWFISLVMISCRASDLKEEIRVRQFAPMFATFNSLWETSKHYIEVKKDLMLGGVKNLKKNNNNISIDDAFEELDGYVYFQFINNSHKVQSYFTLGVSTEVCQLDGEGKVSYKLSLVENVERHYDIFAVSGKDCVILLKMYSDSQCSVEFGHSFLPYFDIADELQRHGNRLLITTATSEESPKLPVPVVGTWLSVMPQDNEKLQYTVPPYIFAVGNNADIFNKIATEDENVLTLTMECNGQSSITVSIGIAEFGEDEANAFSVSTAILNQFIHTTTTSFQNNSSAYDDPDIFSPELSTTGLLASLLQHVQGPAILVIRNSEQESGEILKSSGNLRGSQQQKIDDHNANIDVTDDEYADVFENSYDDYNKNIGDDYDKNISDKNIDIDNITDSRSIQGNNHSGDDDKFTYDDDTANTIELLKTLKKANMTEKWIVTVNCVGDL